MGFIVFSDGLVYNEDMYVDGEQNQMIGRDEENTGEIKQSASFVFEQGDSGQKPIKQRIVKIVSLAFVVVVLVIGLIILFWKGFISNHVNGPSVEEFQKYLEEKYGKDEKFSSVDTSTCIVIDSGFCIKKFVSEKSDGEFEVIYDKNDVLSFSDQYYLVKYKEEFEDYCSDYYGKYFERIIPYNYYLSCNARYPYFDIEERFDSFEEIIQALEKDSLYNSDSVKITIKVDYKDFDSVIGGDFESIEESIAEVIIKNNLNISYIDFVILAINGDSIESCPDGFTVVSGLSCNKNIYRKHSLL